MKFITENDLRDLYREGPFTNYEIELGARLTPGARQFLTDHGIKISDALYTGQNVDKNVISEELKPMLLKPESNWKKKKLYSKMKSMEALFLMTEEELLSRDILLAQSLINLGRQFTNIKNALEGKGTLEKLDCKECTGINSDNFSYDLDDCFEITDFHVQLERGRDIVILHRLRSELREIEPAILEVYEGNEDEDKLYEEAIENINQIINTLSQIICSVFGGKKCQRKS